MTNLILVVMSIALMAWIGLASIDYINPQARVAAMLTPQLKNGFNALEVGYNNYVLATGAKPNLMSDITPSYAFIPAAPTPQVSWTFGSGGTNGAGRYFCLSGSMTPAMLRAASNLQSTLSPQAYFINTTCGVTYTSIPTGANPTAALTYWVSSYQ